MSKIYHDSETPAHGQQVITACAFIHQKVDGIEKLFLPRRAQTKKFLPGVFELPGGHIEFGEDLIHGLLREVYEELNMKIFVGDPFAAYTYMNTIKESHSIEIIYFATFTSSMNELQIHAEDHSEWRWFGEEDLDTLKNFQSEDEEVHIMRKGFSLLKTSELNFG